MGRGRAQEESDFPEGVPKPSSEKLNIAVLAIYSWSLTLSKESCQFLKYFCCWRGVEQKSRAGHWHQGEKIGWKEDYRSWESANIALGTSEEWVMKSIFGYPMKQMLDSQMLWMEKVIQNRIILPNLPFYTAAEDRIYQQQLKGGMMERSEWQFVLSSWVLYLLSVFCFLAVLARPSTYMRTCPNWRPCWAHPVIS